MALLGVLLFRGRERTEQGEREKKKGKKMREKDEEFPRKPPPLTGPPR